MHIQRENTREGKHTIHKCSNICDKQYKCGVVSKSTNSIWRRFMVLFCECKSPNCSKSKLFVEMNTNIIIFQLDMPGPTTASPTSTTTTQGRTSATGSWWQPLSEDVSESSPEVMSPISWSPDSVSTAGSGFLAQPRLVLVIIIIKIIFNIFLDHCNTFLSTHTVFCPTYSFCHSPGLLFLR